MGVVTGSILRVAVSVALVLGIAGAALVAASSGPDQRRGPALERAGFKPGQIGGKWIGEWKNKTFDSKGTIRANVKTPGKKLIPIVNFAGFVFGCDDPDAETVTIKKGRGENRWNSGGFNVTKSTEAFGKVDFTYKHSNHSFKGTGKKPPCNPAISYEIDGKLTKSEFTADVVIDLGGGSTANAKITAEKK